MAEATKAKPFTEVLFETEHHELRFVDCGAGLAVMTPEWDGVALVLQRDDVASLRELCDVVLSRP